VPHGRCAAYRPDGSTLLEISYDRGVAHGPYRDYWPSGRVSLEGQYVDGLQEGEWRFYDWDSGRLREALRFVAGREVVDSESFFRTARSEAE
jgi:antitoxin component YwqK of YwqJK toxin-antitoxin module